MSDLKQFEEKYFGDAPESKKKAGVGASINWADGYNDCLSQTNAKELYEALMRVKVLGVFHSDSEIGRIINAALSKATEKPKP